jgi:hypothetical protein
MSMAALFGCLFLVTIDDRSQVRTKFAWALAQLSLVADRQTVDELTAAIERVSTPLFCDAGQRQGCGTAPNAQSPAAEPESVQAAAATSWPEPKRDPDPATQQSKAAPSPVAWSLEDATAPATSVRSEVFLISGTNVSDQALHDVHAVLKPDSTRRELPLALSVEGHERAGGTAIPAGARFSLIATPPSDDGATEISGAFLTFRYVEAGQRKSVILYLTPALVSRLANRG